jgi:hypothetical protein
VSQRSHQESVEITGHLIDEGSLSRVLNDVGEYGGDYVVHQFDIGHGTADPSYARLEVSAADEETLQRILMRLQTHGVNQVEPGEAEVVPAAQDGVFPGFFAQRDANGTPVPGLVFGSLLASVLVLANFQKDLVQLFTFSILLSTAATLLPYVVCSAADLRLRERGVAGTHGVIALSGATIALVFSLCALFSSGRDALLWGVVLVLAGTPIHWRQRRMRQAAARKQQA